VTALLADHTARDAALGAAEPVRRAGLLAARDALADPELAKAAAGCFEAALAGAARLGLPAADRDRVADFAARYVEAGRCPADDVLDAWHAGRPLIDPTDLTDPADPADPTDPTDPRGLGRPEQEESVPC
jgi:glutamate--cysteine ligase